MKKLLLTTLLLCAGLAATAYEYQFNWNQLSDQLAAQTQSAGGTLAELPTTGINILIHPTQVPNDIEQTGNVEPNLHVWNNDGFETVFPGVKPSGIYEIAVEGDESNKKIFYYYHFDAPHDNLKLEASFGSGSYNQKWYVTNIEREMNAPGTYFFEYNPYEPLKLQEQYSSFSTDETTFYVRVMDDDNCVPTIFYDYSWDWEQRKMDPVTIDGVLWYKYTLKTSAAEHDGVIFSDQGNWNTKTSNIKGLKNGTYYLEYYRNGYGDRYDNLRYVFCGMDKHYVAWSKGEMSNEVSFTTTNEHGSATLTIVCQNADDVSKIGIDQYGALSFPKTATINVSVDDGYYLNKVWFGVPSQGEHAYGFVGHTPLGSGYIEDMGVGDYNLLAGGDEQHLYMVTGTASQGFELVQKDSQGDRYYFSPVVKVYSEGTSLEDLVNAHHSVKRLNQAIDHDLVGVGVRTINGTNVLIARSVDYVANIYPIKEGQELLRDANGQPYEWSNPETKQYAWIALELPDGVNPEDYVGKQLSGIRGMYCPVVDSGEGHLKWYNPFMKVENISQENVVAEGVDTHLITYSVACMTEQSYEHSFTGNRPTDQGSTNTTYQVTGKYYMLKPHLCEICNVIDIMRTDDEVIWIPDTRAIMPIANVDGREQIKPNIYTQNRIVGYANIEQSYSPSEIWKFADEEAGIGEGNRWKMRHKVYNIPGALLLASDFHSNDYPLSVPDRNYDRDLSEGGGLGLHIMGYAHLDTYDKDILVSNSDYWSRYNYGLDKNAYRNDLQIAVNPLSPKFAALSANGNHLVVERCYDNDRIKQQIATITIDEGSSESAVKYTVEYTDPGTLQDARGDADLLTITPAADFAKTTFVIGDKTPDTYISIHDMFYSQPMTSKDENSVLYPEFIYHVRPANQGEGGSNATTDVAGYAPVYKTDVNVAGHSMYTKSEVDGDTDDHLQDDGKVKVYFTPNHATAVTRYDVLGGTAEGYECAITKKSTALTPVNAENFMSYPNEIANAEQYKEYVPEVYTLYNDNTYGCYKEEVGNATITVTPSELYESDSYSGKTDETGEHIYFCNLNLSTVLNLVKNDERYLLRVWRQIGNEKVLLNEQDEFTHEYFSKGLAIIGYEEADLYTHYGELNTWAQKTGNGLDVVSKPLTVPDMFKHKKIGNDTDVTYIVKLYVQDNKVLNAASEAAPAGAPRRAPQDVKAYYVKRVETPVTTKGTITGIDGIHSDAAVSSVRYVNVAGQVSDKPWSGINMVVTTLADGTTRTSKIVR